jgi:hypothetical protein
VFMALREKSFERGSLEARHGDSDRRPACPARWPGRGGVKPFQARQQFGGRRTAGRVASALFLGMVVCLMLRGQTSTPAVYVSTAGNDGTCARGNSAKPCLTFNRAFAIASAGDVVQIAAGTYASQTLTGTKTSVVTFVPASGATVNVPSLSIGPASNLELDGINVTSTDGIDLGDWNATGYTTTNVSLRNVVAPTLFIVAVDTVNIVGGSYGNYDPCQSTTTNEDGVDVYVNAHNISTNRVTFDGVTIHDVTDHNNLCAGLPGAGRHVDCMQVLAGHNLTIRNSHFYNCPTDNFIMRPYLDTLDNITIENNFFGPVMNPGAGGYVGGTGDTVGGTNVFRYNTMMGLYTGVANVQVYGNIFGSQSCPPGTFSYNLFAGSNTCGSNAKANFSMSNFVSNPSPSWQNGLVPDYHLKTGTTAAHGAGNPSAYPSTDIDGDLRTSPPDAGADQYNASGTGPQPPLPPTGLQLTVR